MKRFQLDTTLSLATFLGLFDLLSMPPCLSPSLSFIPPWFLASGLAMTLYTSLWASRVWETSIKPPQPPYLEQVFQGANDVPIFAWMAIPPNAKATIIGTYGITGTLENQWFLQILGRKAYARGYAVILFDWRAHGKTAHLSSSLTSDGLWEGPDFVHIAQQAQLHGCPSPFWLTGYSLGGQLALWGMNATQNLDLKITDEIMGGAVICPNLDANRSLTYLVKHPIGRYLEQAIARNLKSLAWDLYHVHPGKLDKTAIERTHSIESFDQELVIGPLGFDSVQEYYKVSSPLSFLPHLQRPTFILYAEDDPLFAPSLTQDLIEAASQNPKLSLSLTANGGHVGYIANPSCCKTYGDEDCWWAWNRILDWWDQLTPNLLQI